MAVDGKIRLGLLLVSATLSVFATVAAAHGIHMGWSDPIGGGTP